MPKGSSIRRSNALILTSTVLKTSDVSALAPNDYTTFSDTIAFDSNILEQAVRITINNDNLVEDQGSEIFSLELSEPSGGVIGTPGSAIITIADDDCKYFYSQKHTSVVVAKCANIKHIEYRTIF